MHLFKDPQSAGCLQARARLSEYVDNTLPARQAWEVERHLAACPACAQIARELETTVKLLRGMPRRDTGEEFMARLHARLDRLEASAGPFQLGLQPLYLWQILQERLRAARRPALGLGLAAAGMILLWAAPHFLRENGSMAPVGTSVVTPEILHHSVALAASDPFEDPAAANLAAHTALQGVREEANTEEAR